MAHEIDKTADGRDAMVYRGRTPWHRLGTRLTPEESRDLDVVFERAGMHFEVQKLPSHVLVPMAPGKPGTPDVVQDGVAYRVERSSPPYRIVRSDTRIEMGATDERWHPLQNRDAFEPLRNALDDGVAAIETAGVLREGRQVWMLVRFEREHVLRTARKSYGRGRREELRRLEDTLQGETGGGITPYGLLANDHSGRGPAWVKQTAIRVVCANTLECSLRRRSAWSTEVPHGPSVREKYRAAVTGLLEHMVESCQTLADQRDVLKRATLSQAAFSRLVLDRIPPLLLDRGRPDHSTAMDVFVGLNGGLTRSRFESRRQIQHLWVAGKGHRGDRSAWEAWNGLVEWLDHSLSRAVHREHIRSGPNGGLSGLKVEVLQGLLDHARFGSKEAASGFWQVWAKPHGAPVSPSSEGPAPAASAPHCPWAPVGTRLGIHAGSRMTSTPIAMRATPVGRTIRRPWRQTFSASISAARGAIQARLAIPTTNITSMSAQQHPRQNRPWRAPSENPPDTPWR
jgi:hypothetical protein